MASDCKYLFLNNFFEALSLGLLAGAAAAQAPQFPSKNIRMIVPSAPSGGTDLIARFTGQKVGEALGQSVIVDNISGGATRIGIIAAAKAPPDGHTWLISTVNFAYVPAVYAKLPYDPAQDFTPVIHIANSASVLVVHPVVPAKTVREFIALARARPEEVRYASGGPGSVGHLVSELFQMQAKVKLLNVPYKGTGPGVNAVMGGEVHMFIANMATLLPHVRAGRVRALGVTTVTRAKTALEIPTLAESGLPDYDYSGWYGLWLPAKSPAAAVRRINDEYNRVLNDAGVKARFADFTLEAVGGTPEKFGAYVAAEILKWEKVVKDAGVKLD